MRPLSVTIVGWWLLLTALWGVYSSATLDSDPARLHLVASMTNVPVYAQQIFGVINGFMLAFCALVILKGYWWARLLFVGWSFVAFVFGIASIGFLLSLVFSVLSVGVVIFFLSRPRANQWFSEQ